MRAVFPHSELILDACCAINLYSSGHMGSILESLGVSVYIAEYVYTEELVSLTSESNFRELNHEEQYNLDLMMQKGLFALASLSSDLEQNLFVNLASMIDDGEAATAALAVNRRWSLGTDDRGAIGHFTRNGFTFEIVSTLEIVKFWADTNAMEPDMVKTALTNIRTHGRYRPKSSHPLYPWWSKYMKEV